MIAGAKNLHSMWDGISTSLHKADLNDLVYKAKAIPSTDQQIEVLPARWASDTIIASHNAFARLTYEKSGKNWKAAADDAAKYKSAHDELQEQQILKAGSRLAVLLLLIWPD